MGRTHPQERFMKLTRDPLRLIMGIVLIVLGVLELLGVSIPGGNIILGIVVIGAGAMLALRR
jgi:hypothetical protein